MKRFVCTVLALVGSFSCACAEPVRASSFGYDAGDATACLQKALDSTCPKVVVDRTVGGWNVCPLVLRRANLELVIESGVVIRAKRGAFVDGHDTLLSIEAGASNVVIRGGGPESGFAMNKSDYADRSRYAFSTHRHAVALRHCRNVTLRDLTIADAGGDGIYVYHSTDTLIENVTCRSAFRDGMSVISADRLTVRNSRFVGTCGNAPNCGVDVEANNPKDFLTDILFEKCTFADNAASGFCVHLPGLDSTVRPVSMTVRDCEMISNGVDGIVTFTARPEAPVPGRISFENCRARGNRRSALRLTNQERRGVVLDFRDCEFDGRVGATPAIVLSNSQISEDFAGVSFAGCRVLADARDGVYSYSGMTGTGVTGIDGSWTVVWKNGSKEFDLSALRRKYPSDPEVRRFAAAKLDLAALKPVTKGPLAKPVAYPFIRNRFIFVQYVPGPGTYPIRFLLKTLDPARKPRLTVQVRDKPGTDLGSFTTEELSYVHEIKAESALPNVYLFEVDFGLGTLASVESQHPGQGILFNDVVNLFQFADATYYFSVPGSATEVCAELKPEEEMAAVLEDGDGRQVDCQPYSRSGKVLRAKRTVTSADETWAVAFSKVREDGFFRLGAPAVPIATTDPSAVLMSGTAMKPRTGKARLTGKEWLRGKTDRDAVSYKVGETMTFIVRVEDADALPDDLVATWVRTGDDGKVEKGTWNDLREPFVYATSLNRAGFVRLLVEVRDASGSLKMTFDGGAGAEIDSLRQTKPCPGNFEAFWRKRLAAQAKIPMKAKLREWPSPSPAAKVYSVSVPCPGKYPATAWMTVPAASGKYPILAHFHGHGGSWNYKGTQPPTEVCADRIECWVSAHGFELGRERAYYESFRKEVVPAGYEHGFEPVSNARPETAYFAGMSERVVRALEYLKTRPEWDGENMTLEGGSQGGLQSIWGAALVPGVSKADIYIPWCCNVGGTEDGRNHGDWFVKWVPGLDYYDPVNMARLIPKMCKVVVSRAGLGDYISPPSGIAMFYNNLTCPKKCLWLQGSQHGTIPKERDYSFRQEGL